MTNNMFWTLKGIVLGAGFVSIIFSLILYFFIRKSSLSRQMIESARLIEKGAKKFIKRLYFHIGTASAAGFVALLYAYGWKVALIFLSGLISSAICGYIGILGTTKTNIKVAAAANSGLVKAFNIAFRGGKIVGFFVPGLALLAVTSFYLIFKDTSILIALALGGAFFSVFMRLGGGIFAKSADMAVDMTGKIEKNLSEDDSRNPVSVADNVGDNVGDCAGMASDFFATYTLSLIALIITAENIFPGFKEAAYLPLALGAAGLVASFIGTFFVQKSNIKNIFSSFYQGIVVTVILASAGYYFLIDWILKGNGLYRTYDIYFSTLLGLLSVLIILILTHYFSSSNLTPVKSTVKNSIKGRGANIIFGLALSMRSTVLPVVLLSINIFGAYYFAGLYGIALAAFSMFSVILIIVSIDAFGPIVDNAGGIVRFTKSNPETIKIIDSLITAGNTVKAATKIYTIIGVSISLIALFVFQYLNFETSKENLFNLKNYFFLIGILIGALLSYCFSTLSIRSMAKNENILTTEVRRQFQKFSGIMSGKIAPDYQKVIDLATSSAIFGTIIPAVILVITPLALGFVLGPLALMGLIIGVIISGFLLTSSIAGNPYKDTAGSSISPAIKLVVLLVLLIFSSVADINLEIVWKIVIISGLFITALAIVLFWPVKYFKK